MIGFQWSPLSLARRSRRAPRLVAAVVAIVAGHLALLLILNRSADAPPPEAPPPPDRDVPVVEFNTPPPLPLKPRKRNEKRAQALPPKPSPEPAPAPTSVPAVPATTAQPARSDYGRWTVAPEAAPAPGGMAGLAGCTPLTLASLTGAARDACAKRLSELARNAPAFEPTPDKRKAKHIKAWEAYNAAVLAWKRSGSMGPHPCPPQDVPTGKLYLDHRSLVNGARNLGDRPAVKVEFKLRF